MKIYDIKDINKQLSAWKLCFDEEFSEEEISQIRTVFDGVYSKKKYSIEPHIVYRNNVLYVEKKEVKIVIRRFHVYVRYYRTEYVLRHCGSFCSPISVPVQIGVYDYDKEWYDLEDLRAIKNNIRAFSN